MYRVSSGSTLTTCGIGAFQIGRRTSTVLFRGPLPSPICSTTRGRRKDKVQTLLKRNGIRDAIGVHFRDGDIHKVCGGFPVALTPWRWQYSCAPGRAKSYYFGPPEAGVKQVLEAIKSLEHHPEQRVFITSNAKAANSAFLLELERSLGSRLQRINYSSSTATEQKCLMPYYDSMLLANADGFVGNWFSTFSMVIAAQRHNYRSTFVALPPAFAWPPLTVSWVGLYIVISLCIYAHFWRWSGRILSRRLCFLRLAAAIALFFMPPFLGADFVPSVVIERLLLTSYYIQYVW